MGKEVSVINYDLKQTVIKRENGFNSCCEQAITDFIENNGYKPTVDSIIERLKHKPPTGYIVNFNDDERVINGSKARN